MDESTIKAVVFLLDSMDDDDPEGTHMEAEHILYLVAPEEVRDAYDRLRDRVTF